MCQSWASRGVDGQLEGAGPRQPGREPPPTPPAHLSWLVEWEVTRRVPSQLTTTAQSTFSAASFQTPTWPMQRHPPTTPWPLPSSAPSSQTLLTQVLAESTSCVCQLRLSLLPCSAPTTSCALSALEAGGLH